MYLFHSFFKDSINEDILRLIIKNLVSIIRLDNEININYIILISEMIIEFTDSQNNLIKIINFLLEIEIEDIFFNLMESDLIIIM